MIFKKYQNFRKYPFEGGRQRGKAVRLQAKLRRLGQCHAVQAIHFYYFAFVFGMIIIRFGYVVLMVISYWF